MNQKTQRMLMFGGLAVAGMAVAGYVLLSGETEEAPKSTSGTIYYTGPMKSKNPSKPDVYGNVDGSQISAAEAKSAAEKWEKENLTK